MSTNSRSFDEALGLRIREAREKAKLKQEQLGKAVGLSRTSITNIERGRQGVQVYLLVRIAQELGRSPAELLPGSSPRAPGRLPDRVQELEPEKRAWAERVLMTPPEDEHAP
jgi:transcriptional regulator with XRE-family HTH domain